MWATLASSPTAEQAERLQQLVVVPAGKRLSELDRLRRSPRDISARGVGKALERYESLRRRPPERPLNCETLIKFELRSTPDHKRQAQCLFLKLSCQIDLYRDIAQYTLWAFGHPSSCHRRGRAAG